jgi:ferritin-like metal-binding protein YciE
MEVIKDLRGLLIHHLKNLYSAEEQMMKTLPVLIKKANHSSLKNAIKHHLTITGEQKKRLEQVTQLISETVSSNGNDL